jgi:hypothetical protein
LGLRLTSRQDINLDCKRPHRRAEVHIGESKNEPHRKGAALDGFVLGWRVLDAKDARVEPRAQRRLHDPRVTGMLVHPAGSRKGLEAIAAACMWVFESFNQANHRR